MSFIINIFAQYNNDTVMIEKFNYEALGGTREVSFNKGEWLIDIYNIPGGIQYEFAPAKDFYVIQKLYHENGILESQGKRLGNVPFGIWDYFDEKGNMMKEVDEDAKFGKIKPKDIVRIMEEVGWINRQTGESITSKTPIATDGNFYKTLFFLSNERNFQIYFSPAKYGKKREELQPPTWSFGYLENPIYTYYEVDGNTGKYERFEVMRFKYE